MTVVTPYREVGWKAGLVGRVMDYVLKGSVIE
jgi:hypothetical protein